MIIYNISSGKIEGNISPEEQALIVLENLGSEYAMISGDNYNGEPLYRDGNFVDYTDEEKENIFLQNNLNSFRQERNDLLQKSDWTQVLDSPLSDSKKTEWQTYRQQLRDMPQQDGFDPLNPVYPDEPS